MSTQNKNYRYYRAGQLNMAVAIINHVNSFPVDTWATDTEIEQFIVDNFDFSVEQIMGEEESFISETEEKKLNS